MHQLVLKWSGHQAVLVSSGRPAFLVNWPSKQIVPFFVFIPSKIDMIESVLFLLSLLSTNTIL